MSIEETNIESISFSENNLELITITESISQIEKQALINENKINDYDNLNKKTNEKDISFNMINKENENQHKVSN
jgi:hypothetical protein